LIGAAETIFQASWAPAGISMLLVGAQLLGTTVTLQTSCDVPLTTSET